MTVEMEERRSAIEAFVNQEHNITFAQLKKRFSTVSDMTLRTDLKALDHERRIVRVHGGARSVGHVVGTDGLIDERRIRNVEAKRVIAEKAKDLVRSDTTIYLDSGSTTTELAAAVDDVHALFLTNSITCVTELARLEHAQVMVPGGTLNRYSMSLSGGRTIEAIKNLSIDVLFLGVTSYHPDLGIGCGVDEEAALKRVCIEQAGSVVALMDATKVGHRSTFRVCGLESIDVLVGDGNFSSEFLGRCEEANVQVL